MRRLDRLVVQTADGISFTLALAGPVRRLLALVLDWCVVAGSITVLSQLVSLGGAVRSDVTMAAVIGGSFVISWGYWMALEWAWGGQTIGKKVLGLRVVDERAMPLKPAQVVLRNLLRPIDSLPLLYLVGGVAVMLSPRCQRLGDLAAGTVVVAVRKPVLPVVDEQVLEGRHNSFAQYPHLESRLRQRASSEQVQLALETLRRRNRLEPSARVQVFEELAASMRELVEFPAAACEGLSGEQYVRNALHSILRGLSKPRGPAIQPAARARKR